MVFMANNSILKKILGISPIIEVLFRVAYWKNIKLYLYIKKLVSKKIGGKPIKNRQRISWNLIKNELIKLGVKEGDTLVIHSSFQPLKSTGLSPSEIVDDLLSIVGNDGTLAMPAMPLFRNDVPMEKYLDVDISEKIYVYKRHKTPIKTGALPMALAKKKGAIRSPHPINTMVAVGRLAYSLMEGNIEGVSPLPCGVNSSWKKCVDYNAWVIGLGVDLAHSLTMIHVAEDVKDDKWPIKNWYRNKHFKIIDNGFTLEKTLRERQPLWGALHFAERTLCKDLLASGLMSSHCIEGVIIEAVRSQDLLNLLNSKNVNGYPYFGIPNAYKNKS